MDGFRDLKIREVQVRPVIKVPFPMGTVGVVKDMVGVMVVHDALVRAIDPESRLPGVRAEMDVTAWRMTIAQTHVVAHLVHGRRSIVIGQWFQCPSGMFLHHVAGDDESVGARVISHERVDIAAEAVPVRFGGVHVDAPMEHAASPGRRIVV